MVYFNFESVLKIKRESTMLFCYFLLFTKTLNWFVAGDVDREVYW